MAAENARMKRLLKELEPLIRQLRLARFAPSSEKLDPDQLQLCFEDLEQAVAAVKEKHGVKDAPDGEAEEAPATGERRGRPTKEEAPVRRSLPQDLPRIEERIQPDSLICPCGCGQMVQIGEDRSERIDIVPAQLRVIETVRPRYACPKGRANVVRRRHLKRELFEDAPDLADLLGAGRRLDPFRQIVAVVQPDPRVPAHQGTHCDEWH